jgi:hypothetical protein
MTKVFLLNCMDIWTKAVRLTPSPYLKRRLLCVKTKLLILEDRASTLK